MFLCIRFARLGILLRIPVAKTAPGLGLILDSPWLLYEGGAMSVVAQEIKRRQ
jgi:hypothetical protein